MKLHQLPKIKANTKKRLGRGVGSGRGKTSGRGTKGQKARGKIPAAAVGGGLILYKKLPFRRGLGNTRTSQKAVVIALEQLNNLKPKTVVNVETLVESGLVEQKEAAKKGVKILRRGEIGVPLKVELPVSRKVKQLIEKAGGEVVS